MSFWFFFIDTTPASVASEFGGFFIALFPSPLPPQHISLQIQWYAPRSFASSFLFFRNYLNSFTDSNLIFIFFLWFCGELEWTELRPRRRNCRTQWGRSRCRSLFSTSPSVKVEIVSPEPPRFSSLFSLDPLFLFFLHFFKFKIPFLLSVLQVLEQLSGQTPVFSKG